MQSNPGSNDNIIINTEEDLVNFIKKRNKKSLEMYARACNSIPAGVTSRGRQFPPFPFLVKKASGSRIVDIDDNEYIDCAMSYGIAILGHCPDVVVAKIKETLEIGTNYAMEHPGTLKYAELIKKAVPGIDKITFCNSGTEANIHAIRIARAFSKKSLIAKFEGGYHGDQDYTLVSAFSHPDEESGPVENPLPVIDSIGIPEGSAKNTIILPFNHPNAFKIIEKNKDRIAAVMVEGLQGAGGCMMADRGFIKELREVTEKFGILLIFDEVFTGFRLALGGAQEYFNVRADMVLYGKIVGGGLPCAAIGGKNNVMDIINYSGDHDIDSISKCHYGGTCNGNVLAMAAGHATVEYLLNHPEVYAYMNTQGKRIRSEINEFCQKKGIAAQAIGEGSIFYTHFVTGPIKRTRDLNKVNKKAQHIFFLSLVRHNLFIPYMHLGMISAAHTEKDIDLVIDIHKKALVEAETIALSK
jgi:glutamate-1-semialdehyde 2,1-aminomutase